MLFPLTRASRYSVTVVWEIKYWSLRTINIDIFYLLINKLNKQDLSLMYVCVFRWEFIDFFHFLALLRYPPPPPPCKTMTYTSYRAKKGTKSMNSHPNTHKYVKKAKYIDIYRSQTSVFYFSYNVSTSTITRYRLAPVNGNYIATS